MVIQVGIIGASFAKAAYLPALATIDDAEVVALSSARMASAQATAEAFGVPHVYDDWEAMLANHEFDLVGIATPTVYHAPMTLAALERGAHVLCEKPTAMSSDEAQQMLDKANEQRRIGIMGHELRFNPNRRKIKQLIAEGAIGKVQHVNISNITASWGDPASRPENDWWSMADMGGGRLGANGSHQIDLLRFWLGDIQSIYGQVATLVPNRIGRDTGNEWTATADDQCSFTAMMESGAMATVFLSGVARHAFGNHSQIFGSEGTIVLADNDEKLLVARAGEDFQDMSEHDPNADLPGVNKGIWNVSFVALMQELCAAIREGRGLNNGATFVDGLKNQQAMDAVRQSSEEKRWVTLS